MDTPIRDLVQRLYPFAYSVTGYGNDASLPVWLAVLTRLNPATYGVDLCRRILIPQAAPLTLFGNVVPLWGDAVIILAFGVVTLSLAVKLFANAE